MPGVAKLEAICQPASDEQASGKCVAKKSEATLIASQIGISNARMVETGSLDWSKRQLHRAHVFLEVTNRFHQPY
jgi:hypothetical protein